MALEIALNHCFPYPGRELVFCPYFLASAPMPIPVVAFTIASLGFWGNPGEPPSRFQFGLYASTISPAGSFRFSDQDWACSPISHASPVRSNCACCHPPVQACAIGRYPGGGSHIAARWLVVGSFGCCWILRRGDARGIMDQQGYHFTSIGQVSM